MAISVPALARQETSSETVLNTFFHTDRSKKAAILFVQRLVSTNGRMTPGDVSKFAKDLASGKSAATLSRGAFYEYVLRIFLRHGLIRLGSGFDNVRRKPIPMYFAVVQPVKERAPSGPSLAYNAHVLGKAWNEIFSKGADDRS